MNFIYKLIKYNYINKQVFVNFHIIGEDSFMDIKHTIIMGRVVEINLSND